MILNYLKESSWFCHFQKTVYCVWIVKTYTLMASWPRSFLTVMMIMICGRGTLFGHSLIWFAVTHLLQFCLADCGNGYVAWWVQLCMVRIWVWFCGYDWVWWCGERAFISRLSSWGRWRCGASSHLSQLMHTFKTHTGKQSFTNGQPKRKTNKQTRRYKDMQIEGQEKLPHFKETYKHYHLESARSK